MITLSNITNIIEIQGLSKTFENKSGKDKNNLVLDKINLTIKHNEFVSFIGPSGCGKTTLLKIIAGLLPIDKGKVLIKGNSVNSPGPDRSMVFQSFCLLPWATILSNVAFGLEVRRVPKKEREERAMEMLKIVGLQDYAQHLPRHLSGGMQQRAGIARALVMDPEILLMDEPFGQLDAQTRRGLQEDLMRIWQDHKKTVVFVTHSMDEAVYLSDRVFILKPRPGEIHEIMDIDLLRPRNGNDVRKSQKFAEMTNYVWDTLKILMEAERKEVI
jgi:NitT/TauT family transport system ATP-binding protein